MTAADGHRAKTNRRVGAGALQGILLMFGASLAGMVVEPAGYSGGTDPLPNFAAADGGLRLLYLAAVGIGSVIVGGLMGGIVARVTFALAQRGTSPRSLRVGLAAIGIGAAAVLSKPRTVTVATVGAFVFSIILGAAIGVLIASRATRAAIQGLAKETS